VVYAKKHIPLYIDSDLWKYETERHWERDFPVKKQPRIFLYEKKKKRNFFYITCERCDEKKKKIARKNR
jgi:hypothetical protein